MQALLLVEAYATHNEAGVAAEMRAAKKCSKYVKLCAEISGQFVPAVVERRGTFNDALVGFVKRLGGDQDRDPHPGQHDDYVFSTRSKTTYMAGRICFPLPRSSLMLSWYCRAGHCS